MRREADPGEPQAPSHFPGLSMNVNQHRQARGAPGPADAVFDRWLRGELTRLYDSALSEPLPEDLLRLLQNPMPPASPKDGAAKPEER